MSARSLNAASAKGEGNKGFEMLSESGTAIFAL